MTLMARKSEEYLDLVDHKKGLVDRTIFNDQAIYEMELERIFARSWNFMAHDTQIPNPGDFFMTRIGEDRVIVVRDNDGNPQTLINSCRHRGNAICRADEGHATCAASESAVSVFVSRCLAGLEVVEETNRAHADSLAAQVATLAQTSSYEEALAHHRASRSSS